MANIVLQSVAQFELNHQYAVTAYDVSVKGDRPVTVKFGAQGPIGSSRGQEKPSVSFKFAVPVTGLEFDIVGLLNDPNGFTVSFPIGAERHQVYGVQGTARSFTNNPETGNTEFSFDGVGTEWVRVS